MQDEQPHQLSHLIMDHHQRSKLSQDSYTGCGINRTKWIYSNAAKLGEQGLRFNNHLV